MFATPSPSLIARPKSLAPDHTRGWCLLPFFAALLALAGEQTAAAAASPPPVVLVWDTGTPLRDPVGSASREGWRLVPTDLLQLEADPTRASTDPGYYGRPYAFKGDVVVENRHLNAVFLSNRGAVVLLAKEHPSHSSSSTMDTIEPGTKVAEIVPFDTALPLAAPSRYTLIRNAGDQAAIDVIWDGASAGSRSVRYAFDRTQIVEVKPDKTIAGVRILGPFAGGIAPSLIADDLILDPLAHPGVRSFCVPAENAFLGLVPGEQVVLEMTWPPGRQRLELPLAEPTPGARQIQAIQLTTDGHGVYLAAVCAPGAWHREVLKPAYLEKQTRIAWQQPFPARWKTQLTETDTRTTYAFRNTPTTIWRGVAGTYDYPAWLDGDAAFLLLTKKVPPKGDAIIYFVEGQNTPDWVLTPVDMMKATLGRTFCETLLDPAGRNLRTHHRRGGDGVRRACTCGCTEAIQAVFAAGQEVARKDEIRGAVDDMLFFVQRHVARIDEYKQLSTDVLRRIEAAATRTPELRSFTDPLAALVRQIPDECNAQQDNMKSLDYADRLGRQTVALTTRNDTNNVPAFRKLLDDWRGMGGAQDYVLARCHMLARRLFLEAGLGCADRSDAIELAREIRAACRQCLRNPDGYEIWPNY